MKLLRSASLLLILGLSAVLAGCPGKPAATPPVTPAAPPATTTAAPLSGTLTIGIPCGLAMAYKPARDLFLQQNPGVKLVEHIKNIGPMTREIRDGKVKLDVFLSLGEEEVALLTKGAKLQGEPTPFLRQSMQLLVQKGNPLGVKRIEDLAGPKVKTVAICTPERTLGRAAEDAMKAAGVWEKLETAGKIIRLDQPMQTKEFVFNRKADAAFIYAACSTSEFSAADPERGVVGKAHVVMTVPEKLYGGMLALAAVPADAPHAALAQHFVQFLVSPEVQAAVAKMGYGPVKPTGGARP